MFACYSKPKVCVLSDCLSDDRSRVVKPFKWKEIIFVICMTMKVVSPRTIMVRWYHHELSQALCISTHIYMYVYA